MAKKIPNVSRWGQDKARQRYQFGGFTTPGLPVQANPAAAAAMANRPAMPVVPQAAAALAARPALPAQAMGRRPFKEGGLASKRPGTGMFPGESEQEAQDEEASRQRRKISQPMGAGTTFGAKQSGEARERGIESGFKRGGPALPAQATGRRPFQDGGKVIRTRTIPSDWKTVKPSKTGPGYDITSDKIPDSWEEIKGNK